MSGGRTDAPVPLSTAVEQHVQRQHHQTDPDRYPTKIAHTLLATFV
jgi:hypothetical protein